MRGDSDLVEILSSGLAAVLRSLLLQTTNPHESDKMRMWKRATIEAFIDENLTDPELGPTMLANRFGLSRAALYRLFEPIGGVASLIRNRRLDIAYANLSKSTHCHRDASQIAHTFGFYDGAHFSNRFKDRFGLSPRELVREHPELRANEVFAEPRVLTQWSFDQLFDARN